MIRPPLCVRGFQWGNRGLLVQIGQPVRAAGVAGHTPVATRREGNGTDFGTVGETTALELLGEEAATEGVEPFLNRLFIV